MKKSEDGPLNSNSSDLAKARSTVHCTQVALDVADMPEDLGRVLDKGIEDHFHDR
jgi:hypothetical protein